MAKKQIMIFVFSSWLIIYYLITVLSVCYGQRRIVGGHNVTTHHKHMVYIIKAETSKKTYMGWLCGGTLVKKRIAITSAACVRDVQHMYIIAGYTQYVPDSERESDKCIGSMKKKVVNVCTPKDYNLVYSELSAWANLDIAVVKAESDIAGVKIYEQNCDYIPRPIEVNYDLSLQNTGTMALVLGWGHAKEWRKDKDLTDLNQRVLQYGATRIYDKKKCIRKYSDYKIDSLIDRFMICTWPPGRFKDKDMASDMEENEKYDSKEGVEGCDEENGDNGSSKKKDGNEDDTEELEKSQVGICQNDHGGPLISWYGSKAKIIGVASVFRVNTDRECEGPFLFTSTYCNSKFLKCVIYQLALHDSTKNMEEDNKKVNSRRSMPSYCKLPPQERGFDIIERQISWVDHPDGPAENEVYQMRPQRPLQDYFRH